MIIQPHLILPLLGVTGAYAAQTPLSAGAGCLLSSASGPASYKACCSGNSSGEEFVDGVKFQYTCAKWANPTSASALPAVSARECAQLCIKDSSCSASTFWSSRRKCFLTTVKDFSLGSTSGYLVLEKTSETIDLVSPPSADCEQKVDEAATQCKNEEQLKCGKEKADLEKSSLEKCSNEKAELEQKLKSQCEKDAQEQCSKEKGELEQKVKSQCEKDAQEKCDKEKAQLQQQTQTKPERPDDLSQELARIGRNQLCPGYNGRTFETTNSDGSRNKWLIQCNTMLNRGSWPDQLHQCRHHSIIDTLKEYQEQKGQYKGVWIRVDNLCNHVLNPYLPLIKSPGLNHHFIERVE
ncbi:hypothetical protein PENARI_c011G02986 [Penicillium arizonense]|uniref:Apple domain-containing protein n=1 Tax=Penicillium arizonense TaxID=1835702 RepID=A0A1F5LFH2_PENAI|nr:hypothetical protein PENARI_c011G02986 [Penicillium arizonense]OGE51964.1 hypothetical protein PENARI_c011G02986 [Penicillium arizonense]